MMEEPSTAKAQAARERTPDDAGNGVGERLTVLNQKHDTMRTRLMELEERLRPILRPEEPELASDEIGAVPAEPSPLVRELDRLVSRSRDEADIVQRLLDRLDI